MKWLKAPVTWYRERICRDYVSIIVLTSIWLVLQIASNIIAVRHFLASSRVRVFARETIFILGMSFLSPTVEAERSGYPVIKSSASSSFHLKDLLAKYVSEKYPAIAERTFR